MKYLKFNELKAEWLRSITSTLARLSSMALGLVLGSTLPSFVASQARITLQNVGQIQVPTDRQTIMPACQSSYTSQLKLEDPRQSQVMDSTKEVGIHFPSIGIDKEAKKREQK